VTIGRPAASQILRLTGPIFSPGSHEVKQIESRGWTLTTVAGTSPDQIIPHVAEADIVSVVGTYIPAPVIDAMTGAGIYVPGQTGLMWHMPLHVASWS
jgi:hypothetical protein